MVDAEHECPRCGDPGPPVTVRVPLNPDAPPWDLWWTELWQCRVCLHRYSRAAAAGRRMRAAAAEEAAEACGWEVFEPRRRVITVHAPRYL